MRVLLFTFNFGGSSSGNITKEIADALYEKGVELLVVCGRNFSKPTNYQVVTINPKPTSPARLLKILGNYLGIELNYIFWELRCSMNFEKWHSNFYPDLIYSRGSPVSSMTIGLNFSKKYKIPLILHFADPIPAPFEWIKNKLEHKKLLQTVKNPLINAKKIFFVNKEMLNLQKSYFVNFHLDDKSFILPNHIGKLYKFGPTTSNKKIFLFIGSFSNQRNPILILNTFLNATLPFDNVEFHIYGNNKLTDAYKFFNGKSPRIKFHDPVSNILDLMKNSFVLVDVDSNHENQVFLSGKLMNYLSTDRYILSVTPDNSPSYNLLYKLPCCQIVNHNADSISEAILKFLNKEWIASNFIKRKELVNNYSLDMISDKLINHLKQAIDDRLV